MSFERFPPLLPPYDADPPSVFREQVAAGVQRELDEDTTVDYEPPAPPVFARGVTNADEQR